MGSAVPVVKASLYAMLAAAFTATEPEVLVAYGDPGPIAEDIVAVMGAESEQVATVMRPGPIRPRDETVRATVVVSCYRGGGIEAQRVVTERAYALVAVLETALAADITLGGSAWSAAVIATSLVEDEALDEMGGSAGRVAEVAVTVQAQSRI